MEKCLTNLERLFWSVKHMEDEAVSVMVNEYVDNGVDLNGTDEDGNTLAIVAAGLGRSNTLRALLAHGADMNKVRESDGITPLMAASAGTYEPEYFNQINIEG